MNFLSITVCCIERVCNVGSVYAFTDLTMYGYIHNGD